MLDCRCRTEAADYRKKCRWRTNFSPAFWHLHMNFQYHSKNKNNTNSSYLWTCRVHPFHHHQQQAVWTCRVYPFFKCRNVGLSGVQSVRYRYEQKCWCRNQSGAEIREPSLVQKCSDTGLRYRMLELECRWLQYKTCSPTPLLHLSQSGLLFWRLISVLVLYYRTSCIP